ncbi:MAG: N-acetyl-D-Glu racemase DgcA [Rhodospirillales bacterium]
MGLSLIVRDEVWPLARPFAISRGTKTEAHVVVAELSGGGHTGRGECVPYAHYGETVEGVKQAMTALAPAFAEGLDRAGLQILLPAGAARNALDCALWDLEAKQTGRRVWDLAGLAAPVPCVSAETISVDTPENMAREAARLSGRPLLKLKLDHRQIYERVSAVREAAPSAALVIDPNESWTIDILADLCEALGDLGVEMIEQPLAARADADLAGFRQSIPVCADESCRTADDVADLKDRYDMVNIKLDKTGGLTGALKLADAAREAGLSVMVGCMVATSLAMAPAMLLAHRARVVDLDGPALLKQDRESGLLFNEGRIHPPLPELWG